MIYRLFVFLFLLFSSLYGGEKDIVRTHEVGLYAADYKKLIHTVYEIKKKQQELADLHKNMQRVKKDIILKESRVAMMLDEISKMPIVEVILLNQNSVGLQTEQSINDFQQRSKKLESDDVKLILDK